MAFLIFGGIFGMLAGAFGLHRVLAPAPAVLRGDASRVPHLERLHPTARGYLAFLAWIVPAMGAVTVGGLMLAVGGLFGLDHLVVEVLAAMGLLLLLASWVLGVGYLSVVLFNRPRWLVARPYRHEPGWVRATLDRRRGRRS